MPSASSFSGGAKRRPENPASLPFLGPRVSLREPEDDHQPRLARPLRGSGSSFPTTAPGCSIRRATSSISSSGTASIPPAAFSCSTTRAGRSGGTRRPAKPPAREIHVTTRMVHCFAIARLMGRPGADAFIDHGMAFLWNGHRDAENGGYFWGVGEDGPSDPKAGLWPRLRAPRGVERQGRRPSRCRPAARRCERSPAHALLGKAARRGRRGICRATGSRSAAIAARTPTCT